MPTVRHALPRGRFAEVTPYQLAVLLDQEPPEPDDADKWWLICEANADEPTMAWHARSLARLWAGHRDVLLAAWLADHPGKRPSCWWAYDAPRAPAGSIARAAGTWGSTASCRSRAGASAGEGRRVSRCWPSCRRSGAVCRRIGSWAPT